MKKSLSARRVPRKIGQDDEDDVESPQSSDAGQTSGMDIHHSRISG